MELLARAGYYVGAGEYRQQQEEMQQRERQQIRGIEANLLSQQLSYQQQAQRDAWGAQVDAQRQDAQQQHQINMQANQQQMQQKLAEFRQQERQEALQTKLKSQNELATAKFRDQIEWDQAKHFHGEADDVTSLIREQIASGMDFDTPQQRQEYENKMAEMDRIRKDSTLRPIQIAQGIYEIASRLPIPTKRVPTTEEQLKEQMIEIPDPNNPGKRLIFAPDRDGNPRLISGGDSGGPDKDPAAELQMKTKEQKAKAYNDAYKLLTKTVKAENGMGTQSVPPSPKEVLEYLKQMEEYASGGAQQQPQSQPQSDGGVDMTFKKDKSGRWVPE